MTEYIRSILRTIFKYLDYGKYSGENRAGKRDKM